MTPNPKRVKVAPPTPPSPSRPQQPQRGYLNKEQIQLGVEGLKKCIEQRFAANESNSNKPKNLLEAGNDTQQSKFFVEVVFKKIPKNTKTYIHNIVMPHHWRNHLEPEDYNIVLFVPHIKPKTDAEKIQFSRDRELDLENTRTYYRKLFENKLSDTNRAKITKIITSKEFATEYDTPQKLDKLSKSYDLFLADKRLMANKLNALPRRLGRRFWVREKKVPQIIKLTAKNLNERFDKVISTEPFYILGRTSTEKVQFGTSDQKSKELVKNVQVFLNHLHKLYGDKVRFIRLRTSPGLYLPLFADLSCDN